MAIFIKGTFQMDNFMGKVPTNGRMGTNTRASINIISDTATELTSILTVANTKANGQTAENTEEV